MLGSVLECQDEFTARLFTLEPGLVCWRKSHRNTCVVGKPLRASARNP
jgi:hypothetical protein